MHIQTAGESTKCIGLPEPCYGHLLTAFIARPVPTVSCIRLTMTGQCEVGVVCSLMFRNGGGGQRHTWSIARTFIPAGRKPRATRPHGIRRAKGTPPPTAPGDLVQIDTVHIRPMTNVELRQYSAIDVVSRVVWTTLRSRATAGTARDFVVDPSSWGSLSLRVAIWGSHSMFCRRIHPNSTDVWSDSIGRHSDFSSPARGLSS